MTDLFVLRVFILSLPERAGDFVRVTEEGVFAGSNAADYRAQLIGRALNPASASHDSTAQSQLAVFDVDVRYVR